MRGGASVEGGLIAGRVLPGDGRYFVGRFEFWRLLRTAVWTRPTGVR